VNPLPAPAISGTLSFCSGNSSTLNAGGGFTSYAWSTGASTQTLSVNTSGTYTVTVTNANGCTASTSALVTVNPLPSPAISGTFDFCQGSNTTLNATAGFAGYQWNTGASGASINVSTANTFTVTVTDANGCTGTTSQTTVVNLNPVPSITGTNTICQGANTSFNAGAGYSSYVWSTGATSASVNLNTAGTYTVTVTDANGCTGTTSASLTVNPLPTPAIAGTTAFCQGQSSLLNAGAGYSSYLWNTGDATQQLNVSTSGNYTVTVTNNFGCTASANVSITVNPLPSPSITGPAAICIGNNATLNAGAGYATYLWSNGETTQTITTSSAGTYSVTVTSAAGCTGSTSSSLVVNPLPTPAIAGTMTICQGDLTTLDAGAGYASYLWSNGSTSQTISTGNAGSVTVTVTDGNGCSSPASASVTVNPLPVPVITGLNAFCDGLNSTLDAGSGFASYLWNTGATTRTIVVSTAGSYTVTVTANTGCIGSDNEIVTVYANPVPVINGGTGICQGTSTTLTVPGSYASYQWNTGQTTSSISVSNAGSYAVTVTTADGCTGSTNTQMVINPLPVPVITGVTAVCQGNTTTFDAGAGYTSYLWSDGSTGQTINPGIAGSYTVTVTDVNGCQNNTDISLLVNPLPTPSITGDFEFCQGDNSDLNAGSGYVNYLWSDGSVTPIINVSAAGNYSVTVTDNNGCSATTATAIVVNPLPVPVITGDNTICDGTTTIFNAGNYASYIWSNGSLTPAITVSAAGNYAVTVTDINGCVGSTSETLTVYDLPTATMSGSATICFGETTDLTVSFTGTAPFVYTFSNGSVTSPGINAPATTATLPVSPNNSTTYSLVTVSDANCQGNIAGNAVVTVNQLPQPVISGDLSICDGETTALTATPGFVSYNWSNAATQPNINTGTGGIYTVTVVDQNGCSNTSPAVNLIVNMVPVVSFTNDTSLSCEVPKVNFTNLSVYDPGSYFEWTFGDGGVSNAVNPSHLYAAPGTYQASLTITTPAGCVSSNAQPVSVIFFPLPVADFIYSPGATNVFNGKVSFVDRSDFAVSWLWDFGDGNQSIEQNPSHYFNEVGDFRVSLTITSIAGCIDRYEEVISINPFYIPNAFTPNGDGVNDQFYYSGYDLDISSYRMRIFNRWGQLVFTGLDENDSWSGEGLAGQPAPAGTYVYKLEVTTRGGKEHVFHGQVNLVR
jgi:gliding motility-associated-like protein